MDATNPSQQQQQQHTQSQQQQLLDEKMSLLTEEDWKCLKSKPEDVQIGYRVCKFIKFFADDYNDLFNNASISADPKTPSTTSEIPLQTLLKAKMFYHKVNAIKSMTNRRIPLLDLDFYGLACLFIAQKLDDLILFSIENCMKLYRAITKEGEERKLKKPLEAKFQISIQQYPDENEKMLRRNYLNKIMMSLKDDILKLEQERFCQVESDILVTLGFDLAVETSLEYMGAFLKTFREEVRMMQQQKIEKSKEVMDLLDLIEKYQTDIYNSNMCLYYTPVELALATIRYVSYLENKKDVSLPSYQGQQWWRFFCVNFNVEISNEADFALAFKEFREFVRKITKG